MFQDDKTLVEYIEILFYVLAIMLLNISFVFCLIYVLNLVFNWGIPYSLVTCGFVNMVIVFYVIVRDKITEVKNG